MIAPSPGPHAHPPSGPVVAAILAPSFPTRHLAALTDAIAREFPDVEAVIAPYDEGQAVRSKRGSDPAAAVDPPVLTAAQRSALARAHVALALDLPGPIAQYAPNLRWVQAVGAGIGQLRAAGVPGPGVRLTTAAGAAAVGIAEFVFARVLEVVKDLRAINQAQHDRAWRPLFGESLQGKTIALVGLGAINREVARLAGAFGMRVLASHRSAVPGERVAGIAQVFGAADLVPMVGQADVVVAAVPEGPSTHGILSDELMRAMSPGSILCNVGRGSALDEQALIALLRDGHLGAAILDVSRTEPLPPDDPLWEAPRLYYSAHCAVVVDQLFENLAALFVQNLRRWLQGDPLVNDVMD
ncbi:MAG TPA: NAD(P)-dependent oxidoreductase [Mycobacteriales bacterium]|nr:NAD(P)-dependent oxidoreductase [Mycobacteriales bacterium]